MVDYRKLRELVKLMVENDLSELELRDQQEAVVLKRGAPPGAMPIMGTPIVHHVTPAASHQPATAPADRHPGQVERAPCTSRRTMFRS